MEVIALYLALGAAAGVLAGLLGVGGGIIMVPVLLFSLEQRGVDPAIAMHMALGTSLAIIVLTAISSVRAHHRRGAVKWKVVGRITPGIIVGSLLGALVADLLTGLALKRFFGFFTLGLSVYLAWGGAPPRGRVLPGTVMLSGVGAAIGALSAIMGIGGGSLSVPYLVWRGLEMRNAVASAAAIGLPIAVAGAVGYLFTGWAAPRLPPWSAGYLYLPAALCVAASSVLAAPLGARLAHALDPLLLRRIFAGLLLILGLRMVLG